MPPVFDQELALQGLKMLDAFATELAQAHSLEDLLWELADRIGQLLGFEDCVIYLRDGDLLVQAAAYGVKAEERHVVEPIVLPVGIGIVGTVAATGIAEYVADTRLDERYIADQFDGASELTVPIVFEGEVIGVLDSEASRPNAFSEADRAMFQLLATMSAGRIAWMRSEQERRTEEAKRHAERIEALGLLAAGVAHDFNNLLAVIALNVELALESDLERLGALQSSQLAIARARGLTKQLVTFASGGAPVRQVMSVRPWVERAVAHLKQWPDIELILEIEDDLPELNADPTQLDQILQNLLTNAAEAMDGAGRLEVLARAELDGEGPRLVLEVSDEGPGMPAHIAERIFDPYFTTRTAGSGLGLATAYWAATRHGGTLNVYTIPGEGSTFTLVLPMLPGPVLQASPPTPRGAMRRERLMVVDDEPALLRAVTTLLRRRGYDVVALTDGWEAVRTWREAMHAGKGFDLALLDLTHPGGLGGLDTLRHLQALQPDARAIVMSGYTDDNAMVEYREHGFVARLEKPFDGKALTRALRAAQSVQHS